MCKIQMAQSLRIGHKSKHLINITSLKVHMKRILKQLLLIKMDINTLILIMINTENGIGFIFI